MGKKSGRGGEKKQEEEEEPRARVFVLRVAMHCHCNGCTDKIRAAVKDLALHQGVEAVDQSALESKGEVKLLATADPEKLRQRVRKATGKSVDLFLPKADKDAASAKAEKQAADKADAAAAAQALLLNSLPAHYGQQGSAAWANQLRAASAGAGWNTHGSYGGAQAAYPWAVQQQADPYAAAAAAAAYSGAYPAGGGAWGPYAAYPAAHQGHGAAYGGGAWGGY